MFPPPIPSTDSLGSVRSSNSPEIYSDNVPRLHPKRKTSLDPIPEDCDSKEHDSQLQTKDKQLDRAMKLEPLSSSSLSPKETQMCLCTSPKRIPRPRNAFILYRQRHQAQVFVEHPGASNPQVSKIVGIMWKAEQVDVKESWKALAEAEKERHRRLYPAYRYRPRRERKEALVDGSHDHGAGGNREDKQCPKCHTPYITTPGTMSKLDPRRVPQLNGSADDKRRRLDSASPSSRAVPASDSHVFLPYRTNQPSTPAIAPLTAEYLFSLGYSSAQAGQSYPEGYQNRAAVAANQPASVMSPFSLPLGGSSSSAGTASRRSWMGLPARLPPPSSGGYSYYRSSTSSGLQTPATGFVMSSMPSTGTATSGLPSSQPPPSQRPVEFIDASLKLPPLQTHLSTSGSANGGAKSPSTHETGWW